MIIGGGVAGLAAARSLRLHRISVTLLEAGRKGLKACFNPNLIQSKNRNGHDLVLGPNWIHGTVDNPIYELAREVGSEFATLGHSASIINADGSILPPAEGNMLQTRCWELFESAVEESKNHLHFIRPQASLYDYFRQRSASLFPHNEMTQELFNLCSEIWGFIIGNDIRNQILKYYSLEEPWPGENLFLASSYAKIAQEISHFAPPEDCFLQQRVKKVEYVGGKTRIHATSMSLAADATIIAVPLGCLKKAQIEFSPPLPANVQHGIDHLG